jgi:Holliday junction DNA helicase RuvA
MIAKLKGVIDEIQPTGLVLDVGGVGFELTIPSSTYEKIHSEKKISFFVHTLHKEDQFRLFGFYSKAEKDIFLALINVSGIGPAMAISLLSGLSPERLIEALKSQNTAILTRIPGIGKTKAEKLVFELRRKLPQLERITGPVSEPDGHTHDAVQALVALGYNETDAERCVNELSSSGKDISLEEIIKEALKILG